MVARSEHQLREVATGLHNKALVVPADLRDGAGPLAVAERVEAEWGGADILVNNAGLSRPAPALRLPMSD
jgi:NADP-dependent 3-hydroxy acid dehydrogenase YdfG